MPGTVVVCGATGRVGSLVVSDLRARGLPVRVVGRPSVRLEALASLGAEVRAGDTTDPQFMRAAFRDAATAFLMTPVDTSAEDVNAVQFALIDAAATGLARSETRHVVLLSSWGAELERRVGGIIACHRFEVALGGIDGLNVVHLRPVWFMDNFLWTIPLVRMAGINGSAIDGTVSFPMIAARDIAPVATSLLAEPTFSGASVRYLYGPRAYSLVEML
ncbi:MAG: NmrA family NAD(P)-binding protein, partial [Kofleriaceae bacterium]